MIKLLMWIIVAIVIVGGLVWFMSGDDSTSTITQTDTAENTGSSAQATSVTESSSIESDEEMFNEIDAAMADYE
jgi:hypothetical protein